MESLYLLIPLSLLFLMLMIGALYWAVQNGQYDDLDREGERILFDDSAVSSSGPAPESVAATTGTDAKDER